MTAEISKEYTPSRDEFAAMLTESLAKDDVFEGSVVKGRVVGIEKDLAVIDVGLKMEGRVPLKEFGLGGKPGDIKVGDTVEVYLERIENALGEAVLSRDKARREESWTRLEKLSEKGEKVTGVIFNKVKGGFTVDLDGAVAFLPGSQVDIRPVRDIGPLMHQPMQFQILKMDRRRGNIVVSGTTIGTYTNSGGTLSLTFNANATTARVNTALNSITYRNTVTTAGALSYDYVDLNVTFNDQNTNNNPNE